jgi:hypothetical protein
VIVGLYIAGPLRIGRPLRPMKARHPTNRLAGSLLTVRSAGFPTGVTAGNATPTVENALVGNPELAGMLTPDGRTPDGRLLITDTIELI